MRTKLSNWFYGADLAGGLVTHRSFEVTHCPESPQGTEELLVSESSFNPERFRCYLSRSFCVGVSESSFNPERFRCYLSRSFCVGVKKHWSIETVASCCIQGVALSSIVRGAWYHVRFKQRFVDNRLKV